jgi:hypothetical protein
MTTNTTIDILKKHFDIALETPDEIPYDVPKGWKWVRLNTISEYIQ